MHNYLINIIEHKQQEVRCLHEQLAADAQHPLRVYLNGQKRYQSDKSFKQALMKEELSVIAEIKRKSPSKSHLADIVDPVALAHQYEQGGASAISVLTDHFGFGGSLQDLQSVSAAVALPVLRKDFILDEIQIAESILYGADAILLIVTLLQEQTEILFDKAQQMGMDVLVEVHNARELEYAQSFGAEIIGVNNRDLSSFQVDTHNAFQLKPLYKKSTISVAESGIYDVELARQYRQSGFDAVLVGEALVKCAHPREFIQQCIQE